MAGIRETAEKLWRGELTTRQQHPFTATGELEEIAPKVAFCRWLANFAVCQTGEGLVLIDCGSYSNQDKTLALVRRYSTARVHTVIYTHGHLDHAGAMAPIVAEAGHNRVARPRVVGHRAIAERFDRYKRAADYNRRADELIYGSAAGFPSDYVYPDTYFDHQLNVVAGAEKFQCHHARGETDDHCWVYIPSAKVLCTGDFFIWAAPSAGHPLKAQRYARDWVEALRAMAKSGAEVLLPGHGSPIFGAMRIRQALNDTAEYLTQIHDQSLAMINQGATLDQMLHGIKLPDALTEKPYLGQIFDEGEFAARNVWRVNCGWYDGIPANLKPAPQAEQAAEIAQLAGGSERLVERALARMEEGALAMACHLIEWAAASAPDEPSVHAARARIYAARAAQSPSTLSYRVFHAAAMESASKAGITLPAGDRIF
jgi:alkyl sulfatase BDS1-like metallo-beta-lactamase superfamily hydrolase